MARRDVTHAYVMMGFFLLVLCGLGAYFIWQPTLGQWLAGRSGAPATAAEPSIDAYQALLDAATRRIDANPDTPGPYLRRAEFHHRFGYLEKAVEDYTSAIERGGESDTAYYGRAQALQSLGDDARAVEDYGRAIELAPLNETLVWNRARLRQLLGQWEISVTELTEALEENESGLLYRELAWAQWGIGEYEAALRSFDRVIEIDGAVMHDFMARGVTHAYLGRLPEAKRDLQSAVTYRQPGADYAHLFLWLVCTRLGEREEADETLAEFVSSAGSMQVGTWSPTLARFLLGEVSEDDLLAEAEAGRWMPAEEQLCEAYYYAGVLRLIEGAERTAVDHFRKCLETEVRNYYEYYGAMAELRSLGMME